MTNEVGGNEELDIAEEWTQLFADTADADEVP